MDTFIFTVVGMLVDTIMLFFYLNNYSIKENGKTFAFLTYFIYFITNFILGYTDVELWIRSIINIGLIIVIGYFAYEGINNYEIGKEAIIYILLMGIAELLFIPFVFVIADSFSTDIFNDPNKPYLWLVSMGFSRMIAMCLFVLYRKIKKHSYKTLDKQEMLILYLPLSISFICFLIVLRIVLDIEDFEKEKFPFLLAIFAVALVFYTLIHMIFYEKYVHYRNKNQELLMLKQKDTLKYEYYKNQIESFENIRILYHDLKNHILVSNYDSSYFERTKATLLQYEENFDSGSDILNILLWEKSKEAIKYGINFEYNIEKIDWTFIDDMDMCSILGNLLDNAIESSKELSNIKTPSINIKICYFNNFIIIKIKNDCNTGLKIKLENNIFKTTKENKKIHGIGMNSIKRAVEKYDGCCNFDTENDTFITEILMPCPINQ